MRKVRFVCTSCGYEFVTEILEPDERDRPDVRVRPVVCPKCGGPVERI